MENNSNFDPALDVLRQQTLTQIDRIERMRRLAIWAVVMLEGVVIALFLWLADFSDRTHVLIFIAVLGIWGMIGMALVVLDILQRENTLRILNAIQILKK